MVGLARSLAALVLVTSVAACGGSEPGASSETPSPTADEHRSVIATIPTGQGPISMAAAGGSVWVELHRENHVGRIDPATNEQAEVLDVPIHCGLSGSDDSLWTTIYDSGLVSRVDVQTGELVQQVALPGCGLELDGDSAWVVGPDTGTLWRLVEGRKGIAETHELGHSGIFSIAPAPQALWFSTEEDSRSVIRWDRATHEVRGIAGYPGPVDTVLFAYDHVWAFSRLGDSIFKLDPDTGDVLGEASAVPPAGMVAHEGKLWFSTLDGQLGVLDPETLEVTTVDLGHAPLHRPASGFGSIWVPALEENLVLRIDPSLVN